VVCAGEVVMEDREIQTFDESLDSILSRASRTAADIADRTGYE
jgi:hypothetical protein